MYRSSRHANMRAQVFTFRYDCSCTRCSLTGHDYYTRGTLIALEKQYPGFDKDGLYSLAAAAGATEPTELSTVKTQDGGPLPFASIAARPKL